MHTHTLSVYQYFPYGFVYVYNDVLYNARMCLHALISMNSLKPNKTHHESKLCRRPTRQRAPGPHLLLVVRLRDPAFGDDLPRVRLAGGQVRHLVHAREATLGRKHGG